MPNPMPMSVRGRTSGLDLTTSLTVGSPIAQSIIASDLAECSDDEAIDDDFHEPGLGDGSGNGPVLYKQPSGVAFDYRRPSMLNDVIEPTLTREELQRSRDAERSLLKDNHLLPPKHSPEERRGAFSRLYRALFSTKIRRPTRPDEVPAFGPSESSPLLAGTPRSGPPDAENLDAQWEAAVAHGIIETTWRREAKTIVSYSAPLILTFLLQYSINITSIFTVGRIGKLELGAVTCKLGCQCQPLPLHANVCSVGTMTANIFCYAFFQGLATSLDTLCAQAYGSGHKHLVGLQLQRMIYFLWLLGIPVAVIFFMAGDILALIVPEARSAELAGLYLRIVILGIPGYAAFEGGKRFVQSQGLFSATTCVLLIAAPVNMFINWLLVWHFDLGFIGAPIAVAFTQTLMPILLALYVAFVDGSQCWGGFSKRSLRNWGKIRYRRCRYRR